MVDSDVGKGDFSHTTFKTQKAILPFESSESFVSQEHQGVFCIKLMPEVCQWLLR